MPPNRDGKAPGLSIRHGAVQLQPRQVFPPQDCVGALMLPGHPGAILRTGLERRAACRRNPRMDGQAFIHFRDAGPPPAHGVAQPRSHPCATPSSPSQSWPPPPACSPGKPSAPSWAERWMPAAPRSWSAARITRSAAVIAWVSSKRTRTSISRPMARRRTPRTAGEMGSRRAAGSSAWNNSDKQGAPPGPLALPGLPARPRTSPLGHRAQPQGVENHRHTAEPHGCPGQHGATEPLEGPGRSQGD